MIVNVVIPSAALSFPAANLGGAMIEENRQFVPSEPVEFEE